MATQDAFIYLKFSSATLYVYSHALNDRHYDYICQRFFLP